MRWRTSVTLFASVGVASAALAQSNVDSAHKFAWGENVGWTNWRDANGAMQGVNVGPFVMSGFIWAENVGWMNVGDGTPAAPPHYANVDGADFGVNIDADGHLHGLAWGENVGWINFDGGALATPPQPARIEDSRLFGFVWGENIGWINLDDATHFVAIAPSETVIVSADPPTDNPFVAGQQPYRDVLDTGTGAGLTAGIGGAGSPAQGAIAYSPIEVTFSGAPTPAPATANITIACTGGLCPTVTGVSGSGAGPYNITLSGPIPPGHCTTLTFAGTAPGTALQYQSQPGNVGMDALTNTQDLLALIQALNNGSANLPGNLARYNVNRSTGVNPVNTQDLLRLVQLLNGALTTQAFNGASVAACP